MLKSIQNTFMLVSDALGIKWAPIDIPTSRRFQTLAATFWMTFILIGEPVAVVIFVKLIYSDYWWLALLYAGWMLNDVDICHRGGRRIEWVRNWRIWQCYRDYFPIKLVKTTDLDPERNYLFALYPHGVVCLGAFGVFGTNALDFSTVFPGMTCTMITLAGHFLVPLFREIILSLGFCSSSRESLLSLLDSKKNKGRCVALVIGGAAEALDSQPGEYRVVLSRRKGFVRIALKSGSPLVPVFSFGEVEMFKTVCNPENSFMRRFQETFRKYTGISPVLPIGRGVFQYTFGFVPLRNPVTTVVGAPIEVTKNPDPSDEEVDALHAVFSAKLQELFEAEKHKYLKNPEEARLIIT